MTSGGRFAASATVRDSGEFGLIDILEKALPVGVRSGANLQIGIGDDAAVWRPSPGELVVVTSDSLIEGINFRLDAGWSDWRSLGEKALAVNLSDLAAMGAQARLATITLGLRGTERIGDLEALYQGIGDVAARWGCLVAGGDIVASPASLGLHVTAIGESRNGRVLTRSGARAGDVIAVSGTLGAAAAGLQLLLSAENDPRRRATTAEQLIAAHLRPAPRLDLAPILVEHGASSAMDLSDGLLGDLPKVLVASGVDARIEATNVPVAAAVRGLFPDTWIELALRGGEDYELLFTASAEAYRTIANAAAEIGASVTAIGEILARTGEDQGIWLVGLDGVERAVQAGAFDHFG